MDPALGALEDGVVLCGERRRLVVEHEASEKPSAPREGLTAAVDDAQTALTRAREEQQVVLAALAADNTARAKVEALLPQIEAQQATADLWGSLRTLIGSANGQAFRDFAQGLTLKLVLAHANQHLADIKPRYRLMGVPGHDLEIQVIDRDMANEIRSVNSLSGGETFLVSLALALGLASCSASAASVESLFIDEGFGTLDSETLETAVAALDALQAAGRQIGIISHVEGLAERLGVEVCVEPIGAGRSQVVVRSAT